MAYPFLLCLLGHRLCEDELPATLGEWGSRRCCWHLRCRGKAVSSAASVFLELSGRSVTAHHSSLTIYAQLESCAYYSALCFHVASPGADHGYKDSILHLEGWRRRGKEPEAMRGAVVPKFCSSYRAGWSYAHPGPIAPSSSWLCLGNGRSSPLRPRPCSLHCESLSASPRPHLC